MHSGSGVQILSGDAVCLVGRCWLLLHAAACLCFSRQPDCLPVVHAALAGSCNSHVMVFLCWLCGQAVHISPSLLGCRFEAEERAQDVVFR